MFLAILIAVIVIILIILATLVSLGLVVRRKGNRLYTGMYITALGLFLLSGIFLFSYFSYENNYKFKTGTDLHNSDLIRKGWVPEDFPLNTTDIKVTTNIDNNSVRIICNYTGYLPERYSTSQNLAVYNSIHERPAYKPPFPRNVEFRQIGDGEYVGDKKGKKLYYYKK